MGNARSLDERLAQIDMSDPDACWIWPGKPGSRGYGHWGKSGRLAHRVVYDLKVGPIPLGLQIDHSCHNGAGCVGGVTCPHRLCINWVKHPALATAKENLLASPNTFNAINAGRTACPQGHAYDEVNTTRRSGRRYCRTCERERCHKYYYSNLEIMRARAREYQRRRSRVLVVDGPV